MPNANRKPLKYSIIPQPSNTIKTQPPKPRPKKKKPVRKTPEKPKSKPLRLEIGQAIPHPRCITCVKSPRQIAQSRWAGKLAIIGCGRSGTCYAARAFSAMGIAIGHELEGPNGIADWRITPLNLDLYNYKLHQVRHPLKAIGAMQALPNKAFNYICNFIGVRSGPKLLWCARYWHKWNLLAEKQADFRYQIEEFDNILPQLGELLGAELDINDIRAVPKTQNSRKRYYQPVTWRQLRRLDPGLCAEIVKQGRRYGYNI